MKKLLTLLFIFLFASAAWAQMPPQPEKCPGVSSIQNTSFLIAQKIPNGKYAAVQISGYDTNENWGVVVTDIPASSVQDALHKAKETLTTLAFDYGPIYFSDNSLWGCIYTVHDGYPVIAFTPLP